MIHGDDAFLRRGHDVAREDAPCSSTTFPSIWALWADAVTAMSQVARNVSSSRMRGIAEPLKRDQQQYSRAGKMRVVESDLARDPRVAASADARVEVADASRAVVGCGAISPFISRHGGAFRRSR